MENFVFISPNFPITYHKFVTALKKAGFRVLGIGDTMYHELQDELKKDITEYYFVNKLDDIKAVTTAMEYFIKKYGPISYLESNNEYWLMQDAFLRDKYHILTGLQLKDMDKIKYKSEMKKYFMEAGAKVARYTLVTTIENSERFIEEVGYPVFVKPNLGVGAKDSYAIKNHQELLAFHQKNYEEQFIMEEYLEGEIVSFDGLASWENEPLVIFNEHFPIPPGDVVNLNIDDYYYATTYMNEDFLNLGKRVIKAFDIRKRCFHIEFFKLSKDRPGLAHKGEIIALEVNMRPPGGYTPDLLSIALNANFYDCYAEMMKINKITTDINQEQYLAISVARRDEYQYKYSIEEIKNKYKTALVDYGKYPKSISDDMGDSFFFGKFKDLEAANEFKNYIQEKIS